MDIYWGEYCFFSWLVGFWGYCDGDGVWCVLQIVFQVVGSKSWGLLHLWGRIVFVVGKFYQAYFLRMYVSDITHDNNVPSITLQSTRPRWRSKSTRVALRWRFRPLTRWWRRYRNSYWSSWMRSPLPLMPPYIDLVPWLYCGKLGDFECLLYLLAKVGGGQNLSISLGSCNTTAWSPLAYFPLFPSS